VRLTKRRGQIYWAAGDPPLPHLRPLVIPGPLLQQRWRRDSKLSLADPVQNTPIDALAFAMARKFRQYSMHGLNPGDLRVCGAKSGTLPSSKALITKTVTE